MHSVLELALELSFLLHVSAIFPPTQQNAYILFIIHLKGEIMMNEYIFSYSYFFLIFRFKYF